MQEPHFPPPPLSIAEDEFLEDGEVIVIVDDFPDIVSLLRNEEYTVAQLQEKLVAVKHEWQRTLQYIEQLESA